MYVPRKIFLGNHCSFVLLCIDYCNSLLAELPDSDWKVPKNSKQRSLSHFSVFQIRLSPLLESLHWLPTSKRIDYKLSSLCHSALTGTGPQYLSDLLHVYIPSTVLLLVNCALLQIRFSDYQRSKPNTVAKDLSPIRAPPPRTCSNTVSDMLPLPNLFWNSSLQLSSSNNICLIYL